MIFSTKSATIEEKQVIHSPLQPYLEELSNFPDQGPDYKDRNGIYHYPYLDAYWQEQERYPYLLYSDHTISGFALVRQEHELWEMAEFYVLPKFRHHGLALTCATHIVNKHPGKWKIGYNKHNQSSRALWQKLAERLSKSDILTGELDDSHDFICFAV